MDCERVGVRIAPTEKGGFYVELNGFRIPHITKCTFAPEHGRYGVLRLEIDVDSLDFGRSE